MSNSFDTILDQQKKWMTYWSDASKQLMDTVGADQPRTGADFFTDMFEKQRRFFEESAGIPKHTDQWESQFNQWMQMQREFSDSYFAAAKANAAKIGISMPNMTNGNNPLQYWEKYVKEGNTWIKENLQGRIPMSIRPHFDNFNQAYEGLQKYWETFQKMIQFGMAEPKAWQPFFPADAYQDFIGSFFGFKPVKNMDQILENTNGFFQKLLENVGSFSGNWEETSKQWKQYSDQMAGQSIHPVWQATLATNQVISDGLNSMYQIYGQSEDVALIKIIKDMQFAFHAFLVKSAEMQNMVYQAGQTALPEAITSFYSEFKESKQLPDYPTFFQEYVNILEKHMLKVLGSDSYSKLQSDVAGLGITVKSQFEKMVESAFQNFPFLMKSHADEVAKELQTLRRKVRSMERQLQQLEKKPKNDTNNINNLQADLIHAIGQSDADQKDDLKGIKGIGPKLEKLLNGIGIYSLVQVSQMTNREYDLVDKLIEGFQGRARRDNWAGQAQQLLSNSK